MADSTDIYSLPYLELGDAPDIASGLEGLAEAVEDELERIDGRIDSIVALDPVVASSDTDETNYTGTTFTAGSSPLGAVFVAPPSGKVYITLSAYITQSQDGQASICSFALRAGGTIGSGTSVLAASSNRAIVCGRSVNDSSPALLQGSRRALITGLTPGNTYNARVEYQTTNTGGGTGNISVLYRELIIEPVL